ncbi:MAG: acylphosphatase [Candidatus Diapherotrites archaeon]|nr:acylphosphatase [Candidatus Diapherotrites archaeon]
MEKAYEIVVRGDVQKSAFRRFVKQLAKKHNLFGSVENLDNYDEEVRIICEGEEGNVREFIKRLENPSEEDREETSAAIANIQTNAIPPRGRFENFKIIRGPEEIAERLDEGLVIMNKGFKEQKEGIDRLGEKMDGNFKELKEETKTGFCKMDGNFKVLGEKIDGNFDKMDGNFKSLDTKYGVVSEILMRMNKNLEKIVAKI